LSILVECTRPDGHSDGADVALLVPHFFGQSATVVVLVSDCTGAVAYPCCVACKACCPFIALDRVCSRFGAPRAVAPRTLNKCAYLAVTRSRILTTAPRTALCEQTSAHRFHCGGSDSVKFRGSSTAVDVEAILVDQARWVGRSASFWSRINTGPTRLSKSSALGLAFAIATLREVAVYRIASPHSPPHPPKPKLFPSRDHNHHRKCSLGGDATLRGSQGKTPEG